MDKFNLVIGAGISGTVIAHEIAKNLKEKVVIIDKRDHVGGNCYDFINDQGLLIPLYGPHFFHTNIEKVWNYLHQFVEWNDYNHRVLSRVDDKLVPVPVNITTVNKIFGLNIKTEEEMKVWLEANTAHFAEPKNSEEMTMNRVGKVLYEKMFKNYTIKQWELEPKDMDAQVTARIPVRTDFEDRYFTDKFQGMPTEGYTQIFDRMLDNPLIEKRLGIDYFAAKKELGNPVRTFFTGRIDQFFEGQVAEKLQYRSLKFEYEKVDKEWAQEACTVNYPELSYPFTRITEPKYSTYQKNPQTILIKEFPKAEGEPYYPIFNPKNTEIFAKYQALAAEAEKKNTYFLGRLAQYKYFNMDQAFDNALSFFEKMPK